MNTPWINYEEIKQIDNKRQTITFFTEAHEQTKFSTDDSENEVSTETESDYHGLDTPHSGANRDELNKPSDKSDANHAQDLHRKTDEIKKMADCQVVKNIKEIQKTPADTIQSSHIDGLTEGHYFNEMTDSIITDNRPENFEVAGIIEPSNKRDELIKLGISQQVNVLKKIQTIQSDNSFELSVDHNTTVIDEAAEMDLVMDSQTECETVHNSISDAPLSHIELDKANDILEDVVNPEVIKLEEKNRESIQLGISRLVNTMKRIQTIQTDDPFELSIDHNLSVVDETAEIEDVNESHTNCESELTSESSYIDNATERYDTNKIKPIYEMNEFPQCRKVYCKTVKSMFSTFVEIDEFLHAPIFGEISQNTFEFLDPSNAENFQFDTKFISTSTYYPEQPSCHLVSSTIHEIIYLTNTPHKDGTKKHENNSSKAIMIPMPPSQKKGELNHTNNTHDFIKIRVPVVVGEYNIEICIEEEVLFEEQAIKIKEISKNVVLTRCHFIPTQFSKTLGDGTRPASNGVLSIEGFIVRNIEYSARPNENKCCIQRTEISNLHEKLTLELMVQLLQEQGIRVNYNEINDC